MKKQFRLIGTIASIFWVLIFTSRSYSQSVGINYDAHSANPNALLDIDLALSAGGNGASKGLLIPRMTYSTRTGMTLSGSAQGLIVYQTNDIEGFYYNTSTTATPNWVFLLPGSGAAGGWNLSGNTLTGSGPDLPNEWIGSINNFDYVFKTNNVEKMRIASGGNIGIGTSAPNVNSYGNTGGLLTIQNMPSATTLHGVLELANRTDADLQPIGDVAFSASSQTNALNRRSSLIRASLSGATANNRGSMLQFFTRADGGTNDVAERMRIDNSGNVGIGTETPSAKLHVTGSSGPDAIWFGTGSIAYTSTPVGGINLVGRSTTSDFRLGLQDGNARVSQYWNAYMEGSLKYIASSEPAARMVMHVGTNGYWTFYGAPAGTAGSPITWTQGAYIEPNNFLWLSPRGTSSDLYIPASTGNVGIGTTTPGAKLEVIGDISLPSSGGNKQIYTWSSADANWRIGMSPTPGFTRALATSHVEYLTYAGGVGQGFAVGVNGGNSSFEVQGSDHTAYFRGNVGIGTTAPAEKLHVLGKVRSSDLAGTGDRTLVADANGTIKAGNAAPTTLPELSSGSAPYSGNTWVTFLSRSGAGYLNGIGYNTSGWGNVRITIDGGTPVTMTVPNENFQTDFNATYNYFYGYIPLNARYNTSILIEVQKNIGVSFVNVTASHTKQQ